MRWISICMFAFMLTACEQPEETPKIKRSQTEKLGTVFTSLPENLFTQPSATIIPIPTISGVNAIWGATGRDDDGNIYVGLSTQGGERGTSYLYQFDPIGGTLNQQSDTVAQAQRNQSSKLRQNKLHSKFYQADDGYLYFSSFDETGESAEKNPIYGGALWRKLPNGEQWESVIQAEKALIAVNTNGSYVYALGYWGHVLYQYDTVTKTTSRTEVGSIDGHISRNFLVDEVGHAYVPRVAINDFGEPQVTLVEYSTSLQEVASYPLPSYAAEDFKRHHGIVAYTTMKNGDIYFTTSDGGLYHLSPFSLGDSKLNYLGFMHPDGPSYISSLFAVDGESLIVGISKRRENEWVVYETTLDSSSVHPFKVDGLDRFTVYGSSTRSDDGCMYVAGTYRGEGGSQPLLLKLQY